MELLNIKREVERLSNILGKAEDCLDLRELSTKIQDLDQSIAQPTFWDNSLTAYQTLQEIKFLISNQKKYQQWRSILEDIKVALELLELSADEQLLQEAQSNLTQLQQELNTLEIQQLLSNTYDQNGAFLTITASSNSVDAQDWGSILLRMYHRWSIKQNYLVHVGEGFDADLTSIKYITLEIIGRYAYGYLKSEQGTHAKIMRLSHLKGDGKRHTCFANVVVSPILDESVEFEIPDKDLKITLPRCQRNVNRLETWVQLFHLPTGITVFCNLERNQLQNKEKALAILKSRLVAIALTQGVQLSQIQPQQIKSLSYKLIREYVLHPHKNVKDLRTKVQTTAVAEVLDGEIDLFIKAYLQQ
ncbi:PCRF domain-containing protein [Komarekiella sp. 'clone 1']|uniref:PCRF domain-containing protein n=1 Tax=Komarekiella delphini-convector SJRDD-AB1 TaxID=2593771 RepID=A0AA40SY67_9NOST|nr:PCRF domain-containing protein [Komarekiella delphini-convector]MBD6617167.1 PCRF domain-containing protein [Komarekiella delphini-convector SJRDD-AB1]